MRQTIVRVARVIETGATAFYLWALAQIVTAANEAEARAIEEFARASRDIEDAKVALDYAKEQAAARRKAAVQARTDAKNTAFAANVEADRVKTGAKVA